MTLTLLMIHASHASSSNTTDLWKRSGFSATLLVFFFFALVELLRKIILDTDFADGV